MTEETQPTESAAPEVSPVIEEAQAAAEAQGAEASAVNDAMMAAPEVEPERPRVFCKRRPYMAEVVSLGEDSVTLKFGDGNILVMPIVEFSLKFEILTQ